MRFQANCTAKTTTTTYRVTYRNVWDNRRYPFISGVNQEQADACLNRKLAPASDFCMESDWRVEAD